MSSTSFQELNQTKLFGRIMHPVEQCMACRTEYPYSFKRRVFAGSPGAIAAMLRSVSYVKNSALPARLASAWRFGMAGIEALQVAVRPKLRSGFYIIFFRLIRVFGEEFRAALARTLQRTLRRAMPAIGIDSLSSGLKSLSALFAMSLKHAPKFLLLPSSLPQTSDRTPFGVRSIGIKNCSAVSAMSGSFHV